MMSREVDSYLRALHKANPTEEAVALWGPGPVKPSQLKRLQQGPKRGKGYKGGFHRRGHGSAHGNGGGVAVVMAATDTTDKYQPL